MRDRALASKTAGRFLSMDFINLYHVSDWLIKPCTKEHNCSFVELLAAEDQVPDWFISHWWGDRILDFLACLEQHLLTRGLPPDTFYWVCAYANRLHALHESVSADPKQCSFYKALVLVDFKVLLILDENATAFRRIWCCFEEAMCVDQVRMPLDVSAQGVAGPGLITSGFTKEEEQMDSRKAAASSKQAREYRFPTEIATAGLQFVIQSAKASLDTDRVQVLNSMAGLPIHKPPPEYHPKYNEYNNRLRSLFALTAWQRIMLEEQAESVKADIRNAVRQDRWRKALHFSLAGRTGLDGDVMWNLGLSCSSDFLEDLELNFEGSGLTDSGLAALATTFRNHKGLRKLHLVLSSCSEITNAGLAALAAELPLQLQDLDLDLNDCLQVGNEGVAALRYHLPSTIKAVHLNLQSTSVKNTILDRVKDMTRMLKWKPSLNDCAKPALPVPPKDDQMRAEILMGMEEAFEALKYAREVAQSAWDKAAAKAEAESAAFVQAEDIAEARAAEVLEATKAKNETISLANNAAKETVRAKRDLSVAEDEAVAMAAAKPKKGMAGKKAAAQAAAQLETDLESFKQQTTETVAILEAAMAEVEVVAKAAAEEARIAEEDAVKAEAEMAQAEAEAASKAASATSVAKAIEKAAEVAATAEAQATEAKCYAARDRLEAAEQLALATQTKKDAEAAQAQADRLQALSHKAAEDEAAKATAEGRPSSQVKFQGTIARAVQAQKVATAKAEAQALAKADADEADKVAKTTEEVAKASSEKETAAQSAARAAVREAATAAEATPAAIAKAEEAKSIATAARAIAAAKAKEEASAKVSLEKAVANLTEAREAQADAQAATTKVDGSKAKVAAKATEERSARIAVSIAEAQETRVKADAAAAVKRRKVVVKRNEAAKAEAKAAAAHLAEAVKDESQAAARVAMYR